MNIEMGLRGQYLLDVAAKRLEEKRGLREELEEDVAKFLAVKGNEVTELTPASYVPRQPCKNPKPYPKRKESYPYKDFKYNKQLRDWCGAVEGRALRLSNLIGYSTAWISRAVNGHYQLRFVDFEHIQPAMNQIEADEQSEKLSKIAKKYAGVQP